MICSGAAPACELCGRVASVHSVHRGPIPMCPLLPHSSLQNSIIDQGNACQSARTKQSESRFLLWGQSLHFCRRLAELAAQWFIMHHESIQQSRMIGRLFSLRRRGKHLPYDETPD